MGFLYGYTPHPVFPTTKTRSIMTHQFEVEIALEYGIEEAIVIDKFVGWIQHNMANGKNYHDGRTWTFNSAKAYADIFPYMTESKIKRVIAKLVEQGVIVKGNYNENQYDRTTWYAFTDLGNALVQKCYFHSSKMTNGMIQNEPTIPNNQPNNQQYTLIHSDECAEGELFDKAETSTITMLSSEDKLPYAPAKAEKDGSFEDLWQMYERKGSKANAKKEFYKLTEAEVAMMRLHIPAYLQSRPERRYRQDFERYIKNKTFSSVVYGSRNEVLYDPDASTATATPAQQEFKKQNETVTINGITYR